MAVAELTVSELVSVLGEISTESKELYKQYKILKEQEDEIRFELTHKLKESGLLSAKTDAFTASIAKKPTVTVTHEQSVLDWIKETPDVESDQYIGLKLTPFKTLAMSILKGTGEIIPGTELIETESLSIRANKKK